MSPEPFELSLPSHIEAIQEAAATVAKILQEAGIAEHITYGVEVALREAVANAVIHGNRVDASKVVRVTVKAAPQELEIMVHDEGAGFDPATVPDPTATKHRLKSSGRGIFLMRDFMDRVEWRIRPEGGTSVRMLKKY